MEATTYDYILTGLTLLFWASPLILFSGALITKFIVKKQETTSTSSAFDVKQKAA